MRARIKEIIDEARGVRTFRFDRPEGYEFIAGQYALLTLDGENRPFTMSSSPSSPSLDFTVKRMGRFTGRLFSLSVGDHIDIGDPEDSMLRFDEDKDDLVFIAGGSGITPFISLLRYILDEKPEVKTYLIYGNVTEDDIIFRDEIESMGRPYVHVLSGDPSWKGEKGYISKAILKKYVVNPEAKSFYVCGPPPMVSAVKASLKELGAGDVRVEEWQMPGKSEVVRMGIALNQVYRCSVCGNIVEVVHVGGGELVCCNKPMIRLEEKSEDQGMEKHVPVVEIEDGVVMVTVGSVEHPMEEKHHIEWIEVIADGKVYREYLSPGDEPYAEFRIDADEVTAREYCNLHGLWKSK